MYKLGIVDFNMFSNPSSTRLVFKSPVCSTQSAHVGFQRVQVSMTQCTKILKQLT